MNYLTKIMPEQTHWHTNIRHHYCWISWQETWNELEPAEHEIEMVTCTFGSKREPLFILLFRIEFGVCVWVLDIELKKRLCQFAWPFANQIIWYFDLHKAQSRSSPRPVDSAISLSLVAADQSCCWKIRNENDFYSVFIMCSLVSSHVIFVHFACCGELFHCSFECFRSRIKCIVVNCLSINFWPWDFRAYKFGRNLRIVRTIFATNYLVELGQI